MLGGLVCGTPGEEAAFGEDGPFGPDSQPAFGPLLNEIN
jgi:hypothetical protein